ncbi:tRNA (uracil-5-)-methyltransferase homolog A-like isoform X2 [Dendronephthya gigantea]|uniref:tRNA (uracil-5-)-methyltransferase homolog A-like isoform X2 n=1 Tax=Dendronephthya gigantea TaxID=151771 RepID=UPI00106CCF21|nr:tRNA (uracil-5-)-methyltransferase homolog A-like isoform X2 [Dendronephthya gigantea]
MHINPWQKSPFFVCNGGASQHLNSEDNIWTRLCQLSKYVAISMKHLKKFLIKLKLQPKKVRMVPQRNFAFVTFKCEEDRELALKTLQNYEWRNKILTAKVAKAKEDPFEKKKLQDHTETKDSNENQDGMQTDAGDMKGIRDVVTPLWNMCYEEQQKMKYDVMSQVLKKITKELNAANVGHWVRQNRSQYDGMCCPLEKLLPSPVYEDYRNKCEFTIGPGIAESGKTIGFRLAAYKEGSSAVAEPTECSHIPQGMKDIAQELQNYIRESPLDVFDPSKNKGFWKQLTVRVNLNGDIMCIIQISPDHDMTENEIESEIEKLTKYFRDQNIIKLTSMHVEIASARKTDGTSGNILKHVLGEQYIYEKLCDLTFRISPHAFFQVNTKSAEILYKAIQDWSNVSSDTVILDVCCGTGTIGLSMAKNAKQVIGIELCQEAVEDAKFNAQLNGISNVEYHCGKAEDVIVKTTIALDEEDSEVIAILDPPRAGCHGKVLQAVRRCSRIQKLVYVSCSPSSVIKDFISLCRPMSKRTKGDPFQIVKALPIDLFPQTRYCELIVLLERTK